MKRFIVPDDSVAPNVGNSETTNEPAVVRSPEGHRPHQRDPLLHPLHDPVERVEAAGRSPEGTNPRLQAPVKTISTQTPASSWTPPTRTTLMGLRGPHRKYYVSVHVRMLWMRNIQSRRCRNRSRIHNLAQKPRTSQVHRFSPDLIGQLGNRIPPGIRMGFRILWGIAQRAGGIRSLDPIQIHRSVGRRCLPAGSSMADRAPWSGSSGIRIPAGGIQIPYSVWNQPFPRLRRFSGIWIPAGGILIRPGSGTSQSTSSVSSHQPAQEVFFSCSRLVRILEWGRAWQVALPMHLYFRNKETVSLPRVQQVMAAGGLVWLNWNIS